MNFLTLKTLNFQIVDGCIFVSSNAQQILQDFMSYKKLHLDIDRKNSILIDFLR